MEQLHEKVKKVAGLIKTKRYPSRKLNAPCSLNQNKYAKNFKHSLPSPKRSISIIVIY